MNRETRPGNGGRPAMVVMRRTKLRSLLTPRRSALILLFGAVAAARLGCHDAAPRFAPQAAGVERGQRRMAPSLGGGAHALFALVESLAPGAHVLVSLDFAPGAEAETQAISEALLHHALARGCRAHVMTLWPTGESAAERALGAALARAPERKRYGRDYVSLGFKAGGSGAINALVTDFRGLVATDASDASLDGMEILRGIDGLEDYTLVVTVSAGSPGAKEWAQFAGGRAPPWPPVAAAVAAIDAPALLPYAPQRLAAIAAGLADAAEYERLLAEKTAPGIAGATLPSPARAGGERASTAPPSPVRATGERASATSLIPAQIAGEAVFLALILAALLARTCAAPRDVERRPAP